VRNIIDRVGQVSRSDAIIESKEEKRDEKKLVSWAVVQNLSCQGRRFPVAHQKEKK
jgi:hypothetical protein